MTKGTRRTHSPGLKAKVTDLARANPLRHKFLMRLTFLLLPIVLPIATPREFPSPVPTAAPVEVPANSLPLRGHRSEAQVSWGFAVVARGLENATTGSSVAPKAILSPKLGTWAIESTSFKPLK